MRIRDTIRWLDAVTVVLTDATDSLDIKNNAKLDSQEALRDRPFCDVNSKLPRGDDLFNPDVDG